MKPRKGASRQRAAAEAEGGGWHPSEPSSRGAAEQSRDSPEPPPADRRPRSALWRGRGESPGPQPSGSEQEASRSLCWLPPLLLPGQALPLGFAPRLCPWARSTACRRTRKAAPNPCLWRSGKAGECSWRARFISELRSKDFGCISSPREAPATAAHPQPRTFCFHVSHASLFSPLPCGPGGQCCLGGIAKRLVDSPPVGFQPVGGEWKGKALDSAGSRQQDKGWLRVTQAAARLSADGLPLASRSCKGDLLEERQSWHFPSYERQRLQWKRRKREGEKRQREGERERKNKRRHIVCTYSVKGLVRCFSQNSGEYWRVQLQSPHSL